MGKFLRLKNNNLINLDYIASVVKNGKSIVYEFAGEDASIMEMFETEEECLKRYRSLDSVIDIVNPVSDALEILDEVK